MECVYVHCANCVCPNAEDYDHCCVEGNEDELETISNSNFATSVDYNIKCYDCKQYYGSLKLKFLDFFFCERYKIHYFKK